jgi:hypothetical protein
MTIVLACALVVGCGGSQKPPESADSEVEQTEEPEPEAKPEPPKKVDQEKTDDSSGDEQAGKGKKADSGGDVPAPEFKDGMSVDDAINAVPQGTPRVNIDNETLGKPLMNESLYKPCKLSPSQHFKLRVAIWEGKAVGLDVTMTPANAKVEQCIKDQIKSVTWKDSVKALNTVEYAF